MKKLKFLIVLALCSFSPWVFGQNGTADGTYHFGNLGASNSGGTGFKKQGDKFAISNVALIDSRDNSIYYGFRAPSKGEQADLVIKAEGGSVCKRFTLKDMDLYSFAGSYYKKWPYTKFVITLKNESGGVIASHQIASTVEIGLNAIIRLKDIPFTTAWPTAGYSGVARIELSYIAEDEYPEVLGFKNMTISNISANTLPVGFGTVSAKISSGRLQVDWTTRNEVNNEKFIVQGSKDGANWTNLGTVVSKAELGNSATTLNYSFGIQWGGTVLAGLSLLGLLLLPATKNRWMKLLAVVLAVSALISCAKKNESLLDRELKESKNSPAYIRLAQVDRNGAMTFSEVVVVKN